MAQLLISHGLRREIVQTAIRDISLENRLKIKPASGPEFAELMCRGLIASEIAILADCAESHVRNATRLHYGVAVWYGICAKQHAARAAVLREAYRKLFANHRGCLDPDVTKKSAGLVATFGSPEIVAAHTRYVSRHQLMSV